MKKEVGYFLAVMCVLTLVGCGTLDNAEKTEDNLAQSAVEESIASEEINVVSVLAGVQEPMQDTQLVADVLSQPEEADYQKDAEKSNSDIQEKEESLVDVTETMETSVYKGLQTI